MTEGVIRALLIDANYRVIDFGIENQIREIACMPAIEYLRLDFPGALRSMPDMIVMNREQTSKELVEIKYRNEWNLNLLNEVEHQTRTFGSLVLVCLNAAPEITETTVRSPSTYLRCCRLGHQGDRHEAEVRNGTNVQWVPVSNLRRHPGQWWGLRPMQEVFTQMQDRSAERTLVHAINSLRGIISA